MSQSLPGILKQIIQAVKLHSLEGVVAKRLDSKHRAGERSKSWLKLPLKPGQDFVVEAYRLDGSRLEMLLVGYFENGKLLFAGKVHQGLKPVHDYQAPAANGLAATEPPSLSWVDHRLIRQAHLRGCDHGDWTLYLFLVTVLRSRRTGGESAFYRRWGAGI